MISRVRYVYNKLKPRDDTFGVSDRRVMWREDASALAGRFEPASMDDV